MIATDQKTFERIMKEKSLILNYDPDKKEAAGSPPRSSRMLDLSLKGIEAFLYGLLSEDTDNNGDPIGQIPFLRLQLKKAKREWEHFSAVNPSLKNIPTGIFAENINKLKARIAVAEEESRILHKLLERRKDESKKREPGLRQRRALALSGKIRDGKLSEMGGRLVTQNEKGENVFEDGSLVEEYVEREKARQQQARKSKREQKLKNEAKILKMLVADEDIHKTPCDKCREERQT